MFLGRCTGQRVIVNVRGDLIVRPLPLEQRLLPTKLFGLGQIKDHLLCEYLKSLLGIMEAQFRGKGAPGGAAGVVALLQASNPMRFMLFITTRPKALLYQNEMSLRYAGTRQGKTCHFLEAMPMIGCAMALMQECPPLLCVLESAGFRLPELLQRAGYSETVRVRNSIFADLWLPSCG